MKSSTTFALLIALSCNLLIAQVPEFEWVTGPEGSGYSGYSAMADITSDTSGNVIISASFMGTISFGSTTLNSTGNGGNICIVKYNEEGDVLWARRIGDKNGSSGDVTSDIAGNIYLAGSFSESVTLGSIELDAGFCLLKFDPSGNVLWAKQTTGDGYVSGKCINTDTPGNVYVGGSFGGTPSFEDITLVNEGYTFLAKYDPSGNVQWVKQCTGSGGTNGAYGIGVDKDGNSVITGFFDGELKWGPTTIECTSNESFAVSYNTQGETMWVKHIGQGNWAGGFDAEYDDSGNCYLTGWFKTSAIFDDTTVYAAGSADSYIAKYSPSGVLIWVSTAGGTDTEYGWGIDVDPFNNIVITGCFTNSATFGSTTLTTRSTDLYDIYISKLDESGNFLWAKRAGSDEGDQGRGIIITNKGRVFTTGWIQGTADFDSFDFSPTGSDGIFLSLLEANYIEVTPSSREVEYTASSITFSVDANVQWSVSDTSSWLNSSKNGDNVEVDYFANPDPLERAATITVSGNGCTEIVTVVQDPAPCKLTVTPVNPTVSYNEGIIKLVIDSNSEWSFSESTDWLIATQPHSDTLMIEYSANESDERSSAITVFNSCLATIDVSITQDGKPVFINKLFEDEQLSVYPNPASDKIYLKSGFDLKEEVIISLYDDIGRLVFTQNYNNLLMNEPLEIDVEGIESGIYILRINISDTSGTFVMMKE